MGGVLKFPNNFQIMIPNYEKIEIEMGNKNSEAVLNAKGIYDTAIASGEQREKLRLLDKTQGR